jgi:hypothetical protein
MITIAGDGNAGDDVMTMKYLTSRQIKFALTAVLLLGSAGLGAMTVLGQQGPIGEHPENSPSTRVRVARPRPQPTADLCTASAPLPRPRPKQNSVEEALTAVAAQPSWSPAGYGGFHALSR